MEYGVCLGVYYWNPISRPLLQRETSDVPGRKNTNSITVKGGGEGSKKTSWESKGGQFSYELRGNVDS
jgi:hypothetical protein